MDLPSCVGALTGLVPDSISLAWLDAETPTPTKGVIKHTFNERVKLCTRPFYEQLVNEQLVRDKRPADFVPGALPWGERLADSPFIVHRDKIYLQTVTDLRGQSYFTLAGIVVNPKDFGIFVEDDPDKISVRTYLIDNITGLQLIRD